MYSIRLDSMRNSSRAANYMMLGASKMPRASAEKTDEMFGRCLTRSFGPDMAAAATAASPSKTSV
jgi:hypothetical protein